MEIILYFFCRFDFQWVSGLFSSFGTLFSGSETRRNLFQFIDFTGQFEILERRFYIRLCAFTVTIAIQKDISATYWMPPGIY